MVSFILNTFSAQDSLLISQNMYWSIAESPTNCLAICFEAELSNFCNAGWLKDVCIIVGLRWYYCKRCVFLAWLGVLIVALCAILSKLLQTYEL